MRVALIMVKADSFSYKNRPFVMRKMPDSLTLGMLFAIIKSNFPDIEVEIFDDTIETIDLDSFQADLIGISAITPTFNKAKKYADYFKEKKIPIFIGGTHATLAPESCAENFDSVIVGLANESLVNLINDFKQNNLQKFYYQNPNMSFENFVHPNRKIYEEKSFWGTELNMVQATYGCGNICEFCVQPYVCNGYHQRPVNDVIEEIEKIESEEIEFYDPNLAKDIKYLTELCNGLIPLRKKWFAPMTISVAYNENLLELLQKAGCTGVLIGFESINDNSITAINKGFNKIEHYIEAVTRFHKYNIEVTGSFVLGLDGDDLETPTKLIKFLKDSNIDFPRFTINTPYPGTKYYERMKTENRIIIDDLSKYDCRHCVIKPNLITPEDVENMYKKLWKETYSLKNTISRLSYIKSPIKRLKKIIQNYIAGKAYIKTNIEPSKVY